MPIEEQPKWVPRTGGLMDLKDLSDFVAWAYATGGDDTTPVLVETNVTLRSGNVGIRKLWKG